MTPFELDQKLRSFSEHELLYRQGVDPDQVTPYRYIDQPSGVPRTSYFTSDLMLHDPLAPRSHPLVHVKQHSRFREYPLHQQNPVEMAYIYDGVSREQVGDTVIELTKGQVLIVDSDVVHTTLPLGANDIRIMIQFEKSFFDTSFLTRLDKDSVLSAFIVNAIAKGTAHDGYIVFPSETSRRLPIFMNEFLCEWFEPSPQSTEMIPCLLTLIAAELTCVYSEHNGESPTTHARPVIEVLRYLEKNYRTCTLVEAAQAFNRKPDSLSRMLKRETGQTFNQLLQAQRIAAAKTLLAAGDLPVTGVAKQVGYENMTHFYRIFTKATGISPAAYRKQAMGRP